MAFQLFGHDPILHRDVNIFCPKYRSRADARVRFYTFLHKKVKTNFRSPIRKIIFLCPIFWVCVEDALMERS